MQTPPDNSAILAEARELESLHDRQEQLHGEMEAAHAAYDALQLPPELLRARLKKEAAEEMYRRAINAKNHLVSLRQRHPELFDEGDPPRPRPVEA